VNRDEAINTLLAAVGVLLAALGVVVWLS